MLEIINGVFGKSSINREKRNKEDIDHKRDQTIALIDERTREKAPSMNIHVEYFPFMVRIP